MVNYVKNKSHIESSEIVRKNRLSFADEIVYNRDTYETEKEDPTDRSRFYIHSDQHQRLYRQIHDQHHA